jgi:hypothetical protein
MQFICRISFALVFASMSIGCGGKNTAVLLKMTNATPEALMASYDQMNALTASTPTRPGYLGMKVTSIYLGTTMSDGHVPSAATLWFHPDCLVPSGQGDGSTTLDGKKEAHIARCGIEKGGTASNTEHSTVDHQVMTYVDFARPTDEVNAQLAAQALSIKPGTYSYVGIAMSDPGNTAEGAQEDEDGEQTIGSVPSVKFWHSDMGGSLDATTKKPSLDSSARYKAQNIWYSAITPITIAEGDQVEFTISYDLSAAYWNGDDCSDIPIGVTGGYCHDTEINNKRHFIVLPTMTVTVEKKALQ